MHYRIFGNYSTYKNFLYNLITPLDLVKQFYYSWKEIILISILKWLWVKFIIYGSILYIKPISITIRSLPNILLSHTWFAYLLGTIVFRGQHTWFAYSLGTIIFRGQNMTMTVIFYKKIQLDLTIIEGTATIFAILVKMIILVR